MSTLAARGDRSQNALADIEAVLDTYKDPKHPESISKIETIRALFRASQNAENGLSWGEAMTPAVRLKFFLFCAKNGFDPTGSHVFVLGGRCYVSLEGRLFKANEHRDAKGEPTFGGFAVDRVMTKEEREAYEVPAGAIGWISHFKRRDCEFPFVGVGIAGGPLESNPVAKGRCKLDMAKKRANEKSVKLAYPLGDVEADEVSTGEFVDTTGSSRVVPPDAPKTDAAPATPAPAAAQAAAAQTESPERAAEVERFKRIAKIHGAATTKVRAERELSDPKKVAALDAAGLKALNDAIEAAAADPRGPQLRQEIAAFRVRNPEAFNAKLAEARAVVPDFDPERASADDLAVFLSDLNAAVGAGAAQ